MLILAVNDLAVYGGLPLHYNVKKFLTVDTPSSVKTFLDTLSVLFEVEAGVRHEGDGEHDAEEGAGDHGSV